MTQVIVITNQKGGVGKTTTALSLAHNLKQLGNQVLLVDTDPQSNLSSNFNVDRSKPTVYDAFKSTVDINETIQETEQGYIIASNIMLSTADLEFNVIGREFKLKELLLKIKIKFDYIIIDTPPALNFLTVNALTSANKLIIPLFADFFSLQGLLQLYSTINEIKKHTNSKLNVSGLLFTKHNHRTILARDMVDNVEKIALKLNTKVFKTKIRQSIAVQESQARQMSIAQHADMSNPAIDYRNFTKEFLGME